MARQQKMCELILKRLESMDKNFSISLFSLPNFFSDWKVGRTEEKDGKEVSSMHQLKEFPVQSMCPKRLEL